MLAGVALASTACGLATETRNVPAGPTALHRTSTYRRHAPRHVAARIVPDGAEAWLSLFLAIECDEATVVTTPEVQVTRSKARLGNYFGGGLLVAGGAVAYWAVRNDSSEANSTGDKWEGATTALGVMAVGALFVVLPPLLEGESFEAAPPRVETRSVRRTVCLLAPLADEPVVVRVGEATYELVTDARGAARVPAPVGSGPWRIEVARTRVDDVKLAPGAQLPPQPGGVTSR